jgi:hypothetical protein
MSWDWVDFHRVCSGDVGFGGNSNAYVGKGWVDPPPYRRKRVKFRKHVAVGCDG